MKSKNLSIYLIFLCFITLTFGAKSLPIRGLYKPNQLIVKLNHGVSLIKASKAFNTALGEKIKNIELDSISQYIVVNIHDNSSIKKVKAELENLTNVLVVSYNFLAKIHDNIPKDPLVHQQYALNNTGQAFYSDPESEESYIGSKGADIKAFSAWDWNTGSINITIAILDTGICAEHEDLKGKITQGYNFVNDSYDTSDDNGHGTFVASIAAANTDNDKGMAGVNWNAKLMPIKVADSDGYADYKSLALGIRHAIDKGAQILNISMGGPNPSFILEDALQSAFNNNVIIIASSGNTASSVEYPAAYDKYCLAVGATDEHDKITDYSNYGYTLDLVAPGDKVIGAFFDPQHPDVYDQYALGNGTSFAAPMVSGAAAILKSYKPFLTSSQIVLLIKYTADDININSYPGEDIYAGYGRLNLFKLIGPYTIE